MRTIKKSINTTVADVFRIDLDTMAVEHIATREFVGGLGERLAVSKCRHEFGKDSVDRGLDEGRRDRIRAVYVETDCMVTGYL